MVACSRRGMAIPPISHIHYSLLPTHRRQPTPTLRLCMCRVAWVRGRTASVAREWFLLGQEAITADTHDDSR
jgi:hypothetical protein